jgi:drug/metabolite transporter (DMT)-like permease
MAQSKLKLSQYIILALVAICAPLGDSCLARGMRELPPISLHHPLALISAIFTPWIGAGIVMLISFFACYLTALSWADLTFVLPTTAFGYVIIALLGKFWLQEQISVYRWAGILLITLGVGFVAQGPSRTEPEATESSEPSPLLTDMLPAIAAEASELEEAAVGDASSSRENAWKGRQ